MAEQVRKLPFLERVSFSYVFRHILQRDDEDGNLAARESRKTLLSDRRLSPRFLTCAFAVSRGSQLSQNERAKQSENWEKFPPVRI